MSYMTSMTSYFPYRMRWLMFVFLLELDGPTFTVSLQLCGFCIPGYWLLIALFRVPITVAGLALS